MLNLINPDGRILSVDIKQRRPPRYCNVTLFQGSSTNSEIFDKISKICKNKKTMVILDSDHSKDHVLKELKMYSELVSAGQYLIVEDTNLNGNPVTSKGFGGNSPGPMEAVNIFLDEHKNFKIDSGCEKFLLTMHPNGYLKKVS